MKSTRFRRRAGWTLIGLSLLLHLFTVFAYTHCPDDLAAFTVVPVWIWGGIGLLLSVTAFWFLWAPLSWVITGVWAITVLLLADEAWVIANVGKAPPRPGPAGNEDGRPLIRVLTLNCSYFNYNGGSDPADDIRRWDPDVVLLQEVRPHQVRHIADTLFFGRGDYRLFSSNGIVSRWSIRREVNPSKPGYRVQQVTIRRPDGNEFEVVNLHLKSAATDLRLWRKESWKTHRQNRITHRDELSIALGILSDTGEGLPAIVGGDFNSPARDPIQALLKPDYDDAFIEAGTGWGNTYQRRIPVQRIDQIHYSRQFKAVHCRAVTTRRSDHRMVVADLLPAQ
ncbi:endonuclease/exonuclease/phosphatase family protein [Luteolibacter marinus]|uniref:endonuclease/exonuclease/phosphatase family protein n=1 Tax=Luteolibacter marinus TaxID=2776705 RepID=UPI001867C49B|nr:endonuclease/exonuclease/phosphatase family protein [Luteolibacter marinus]